jgi:putative nucleotidyltransferase with HDIG domain
MKMSYYNKIKLLSLIVIYLPSLFIGIGFLMAFEKGTGIHLQAVHIAIFIALDSLIAIFLSKKIRGLFDEELDHLSMLDALNCGDAIFDHKIQKLKNASNAIDKLIQTIKEQEQATHDDMMAFKALHQNELDKKIVLENAIELQNKINHALLDLTSQFLIRIDREGTILQINNAFTMRLGYSDHELIGKCITDYIKTENANKDSDKTINDNNLWLEKIIQSQNEPIFLSMLMKASNPNANEYISITTTPLKDGTFLCVGKAINDEIALQSNILRKNRELEYINQINSSLISNWDIEALLDNIIKRIDYLFNIKLGGIYVLDDTKKWQLKSYASKHYSIEQIIALDLENLFSEDMLKNATIKTIESNIENLNYLILSPLEVDQEIIAILVLAMGQEMNANDINILKMFKNQASMVIQRAIIYDELRKQYFGTIEALVNVIEAKDKYTEGHSRRVSRFAVEIAKEMGYSNEEIENIEIAGLLHDVGKIGIDQSILAKRGRLTDYEYEVIKEHPTKGIQILEAISFDEKIRDGILYHHLRYDLSGYPKSNIEKLPLYACIIGIADAFDAITSARSYSKARTIDDALKEFVKLEGRQFDPEMVRVFKRMITQNRERLQSIIDDVEVNQLD